MPDLKLPRSSSVTVAGLLAVVTGYLWLGLSVAALLWGSGPKQWHNFGIRFRVIAPFVFVGLISAGTLIGGFGVLFRRNWGRILAIVLTGPWMFFVLWFLQPLVHQPARLIPVSFVVLFALPVLAAVAWLILLIGKRVRAEFLPPVVVEIYVNLLKQGASGARPARALTLGNGLFEMLSPEGFDPDVEHWEFRPGSIVRGTPTQRDCKPYLLATAFGR